MHDHTYRFFIRQGEFELDVEGDRNFVESYVAAFLAGEAELEGKKVLRRPGGRKKEAFKSSGQVDRAALQEFAKGRRLESDSHRYLAFAFFLKKQGIGEVNAGLMRECYDALNIPYSPTSRQNLFLMKKNGKAEKGSRQGYFALTAKGESEAEKLGLPAKPPKKRKAAKPRKSKK
ncbi:MAG TPA: hypothetical protein PK747_02330 [Acidobacteriota bacterium]|nr:hypothetical protein [Acidobacteriota bacterium]HQQ46231.1 hypothetical protein [Acidobacteriota bacterium]